MITKSDIIKAAHENGFEDIGFTTADPFPDHKKFLLDHRKEYEWAEAVGLKLLSGTDPLTVLPSAKTIIVLMEVYFRKSYPRSMEKNFGRCYLDDDRITHDGLYKRIKAFRSFLRDNNIDSKVPFNLPHRMAAARAGMGTFGKNCLFYSNKVTRKGSWILPIAIIIDKTFEPDSPTIELGCPDWCKNSCISACPTRALKGNTRIDPHKCISYLTYFGDGLTPLELREPMGMFVYGCDRCQDVCPRNQPWLAKDLPVNKKVVTKKDYFELSRLLHMDKEYFETNIWPHMFYMSYKDIWRWKMNVARVMGNSHDEMYISDLVRAFKENTDERVRAMAVWAIGNINGPKAQTALKNLTDDTSALVKKEMQRLKELYE
ncbi:MAG: epoxyqueuosine reductase [Desulfobacteraceae bacterium]|nr:epoxyqueuosine reductase [Desulfobacteraceae bacterium]